MSLATKLGLGTLCALAVGILTIAFWPASVSDKAREDGEQLGTAVSSLYAADTTDEVDAALEDVSDAAADTGAHAGDQVDERVNDAADALNRAADGFVGSVTADNEFDQELYEYELDVALDDLADGAEDTREDAPEVEQAFWDGFDSTFTTA
jgi:acyl-CoA reductase-like NAD-dependent aldehyde dehydrogenase